MISWLEATLLSIAYQSFQDWQVVLSLDGNDGQTSEALRLTSSIIQPSDKLIIVKSRRAGIVETLNKGLLACNTAYTARLDCDDICTNSRLYEQYHFLESHPHSVACGTQIELVDEEGIILHQKRRHYPLTNFQTVATGAFFNTPIAHPSLMFRTKAVVAIGGYRNMQHMEDYDLIARLSAVGDISNIPSVGLLYRVHPAQVTQSNTPSRLNLLRARSIFLKRLVHISPFYLLFCVIPFLFFLIGARNERKLRKGASLVLASQRQLIKKVVSLL